MARARNIKPSFFTNDLLGECEPLARLLFAGLWTIADREGRLHDRPKKIKVEILPYDDCDIELLLIQLEKQGFVLRFDLGESKYIQILNFQKHQNPHVKEGASTIPTPDSHHTSMVQNVPLPPSPILNPPSLLLKPENKKYFFDAGYYKKLNEKRINGYLTDDEKKFLKEYDANQINQLRG